MKKGYPAGKSAGYPFCIGCSYFDKRYDQTNLLVFLFGVFWICRVDLRVARQLSCGIIQCNFAERSFVFGTENVYPYTGLRVRLGRDIVD